MIIKSLGFKWFVRSAYSHYKDLIQRKIFCDFFNVHRISSNKVSIINSREKNIHCDYLCCRRCNTYYFRNKYQKENYRRIHESSKAKMKDFTKYVEKYTKKDRKIKEFE